MTYYDGGSAAGNLNNGQTYFVRDTGDHQTFKLYNSFDDAKNDVGAVDITSSGGANQSIVGNVGLTNGSTDPGTASNSQDRTSAISYQALNGTGGFSTKAPNQTSLGSALIGPTVGTNAAIGGSAQVNTGTGDITVNAVENLHMTTTQGGVAIGGLGIGAGIGVLNIASNVSATAGGTLSAGGAINIHADLYEKVNEVAFAAAGGVIGRCRRRGDQRQQHDHRRVEQ